MLEQKPLTVEITRPEHIKLRGVPISLNVYDGAGTITNKYFERFQMQEFEKLYLSDSMKPFTETNSPLARPSKLSGLKPV